MNMNVLISLLVLFGLVAPSAGQEQAGCTDVLAVEDPSLISLAGVFDTSEYYWSPDIFEVTVKLINQGWWNVIPDGSNIRFEYVLEDSMCDETTTMRSYWKIRTENGNKPMHGVIGARCSGATMALSRIAALENVPQISPSSNSAQLSNDIEFPNFSRMVSPNDERGEVGAIIAMLRSFGWEKIGILATDTLFSKDSVNAFKKSWVGDHGTWFGQVAFSDTIRLTEGIVDEEGLRQVFESIPTDPEVNSRVIFLVAHPEHAIPIIQAAAESRLVPEDTIWIGPSSWAKKVNLQDSWLPAHPGYIGLTPLYNRDHVYEDFMLELQTFQREAGKEVLQELPTFAAETADAIRALAAALASSNDRRDGEAVIQLLRSLEFDGVSGHVAFTAEGNRKDPLYSIFNVKSAGDGLAWEDIGTVGNEIGSAVLTNGIESVCFADVGCGLSAAPDDTYPLGPLAAWAITIIFFLVIVLVALVTVLFMYRSKSLKTKKYKRELAAFRDSVVGIRTASDGFCIPRVTKNVGDIEQALSLSGKLSVSPSMNIHWMWKETNGFMKNHHHSEVFGDPNDCWVLYNASCTKSIEEAYKKGSKEYSPLPGYVINFQKMKQTKVATGFERDIRRTGSASTDQSDQTQYTIDLSEVAVAEEAPADIKKEPMLVLCGGDVIQISKQRPDGWAFGTKLHHTDEAVAQQLVVFALDGMEQQDEGQVSRDSGWFELEKTRIPSLDDLEVIKKSVGEGALDTPRNWIDVADTSVMEKVELKPGDQERADVEAAFLSTLSSKTRILKVERIQNLAMWQTYVVKRQTICHRETGQSGGVFVQEALQRFERKWLFHGTNYQTMDKILQQGFNRSFCGKNATMYGKGVYFARDSKYSSHEIYAVPDLQGRQYMMACRVVAGEYCRGKADALTPDIRDHKTQLLFDSTVDNTSNPSIFVTYHDAQAYPEYLITFKTD